MQHEHNLETDSPNSFILENVYTINIGLDPKTIAAT